MKNKKLVASILLAIIVVLAGIFVFTQNSQAEKAGANK